MKTSSKQKNTGKTTRRGKHSPTVDYDEYLLEELRDIDYAAGYLTACLEEGEDVFLIAVRNVAKAQGGMKALSGTTRLNRESLYDMLSENGNPRLTSLTSVLDGLGFRVELLPKERRKKVA